MFTHEECRAKAAEADRMEGLVSLATDKALFRAQAREWRLRASEVEPKPGGENPSPASTRRPFSARR